MRRNSANSASPIQAAEEPPNQVLPNQRERLKVVQEPLSLGRVDGSAFKLLDSGQLVVNESQIWNPLIKTGFVVRNTRRKIAPKYLRP